MKTKDKQNEDQRQIKETTQNRKLKQWAKHTPTPIPKRGEPRCSWRINSTFISKDSCTSKGAATECLDSNSTCTAESSSGNKCSCTAQYYDNDLDDNNEAGTCVLSKLY
jgi:hypothetical protein